MREIQPRISIRYRLNECQPPNRPEELGSGSEVHRFQVQFGHPLLVKGRNQIVAPHLLNQNEQGRGCNSQCRRSSVDYAACSSAQYLVSANAIIRAESQPGYKMDLRFPSTHVEPDFTDEGLCGHHVDSIDLG